MKMCCVASGLLAWIVSTGAVYAQNGYTFRDLGNFGAARARVVAINDHGLMLVTAYDGGCCERSVLVDGSLVTPLPAGMVGTAINNRGEVAGYLAKPADPSRDYFPSPEAVLYSRATLTSLAPGFGEAFAINDRGDVAGVDWPKFVWRAVVWENGVTRVLDEAIAGSGFSAPRAYAMGINDKGLVVGFKANNVSGSGFEQLQRAVYWDQSGLHYLSPPRAPGLLGDEHQYATAVNKRGDILIYTYGDFSRCVPRRVFIFRDGAYLQVPLPPAGGYAVAINDSGEVAGRTDDGGLPQCGGPQLPMLAFVGDEKSFTFLPTPAGVRSSDASAINKRGTVGGLVWLTNGEQHAAVWEKR